LERKPGKLFPALVSLICRSEDAVSFDQPIIRKDVFAYYFCQLTLSIERMKTKASNMTLLIDTKVITMPARSRTYVFYQKNNVTGLLSGGENRRVIQANNIALAESCSDDATPASLLASDLNGSIFEVISSTSRETHAYSAYGFNLKLPSPNTLFGFNKEMVDLSRCAYLLGSYRTYSPGLKRFQSPDNLSPFEAGGLNSYCYVSGDPINQVDPSGHAFIKGLKNLLGRQERKFERIKRYNDDASHYNAKAKPLTLRDNARSAADGRVDITKLYFNRETIEQIDQLPARPILSNKDRHYANKHERAVAQLVEDPRESPSYLFTQVLIKKNLKELNRLRREIHPAKAAREVRGHVPESSLPGYWTGRKPRDRFGFNPEV